MSKLVEKRKPCFYTKSETFTMTDIKIFNKHVNDWIESLEEDECELIDIKFSTSVDDEDLYYSAMIIWKERVMGTVKSYE